VLQVLRVRSRVECSLEAGQQRGVVTVVRRRFIMLDERRGQDDGQADKEEDDGERRQPVGQPEPFHEREDYLERNPRPDGVDGKHPPERAAVDLPDEAAERAHRGSRTARRNTSVGGASAVLAAMPCPVSSSCIGVHEAAMIRGAPK
jgi:hypothetical protein